MRQSVRDNFIAFNAPLEGRMPCMYLDVKGLVTCAVGVLIEPIEYALKLHWEKRTGQVATSSEIRAEWQRVKSSQFATGFNTEYWKRHAELLLSDAEMDSVIMQKAEEFDMILASRLSGYPEWPADAQMATMSMAWAMGPYFVYPVWVAAARRCDWRGCAAECQISEKGNPGLIPRNLANKALFLAATDSVDAAVLHWKGN